MHAAVNARGASQPQLQAETGDCITWAEALHTFTNLDKFDRG
jgi:hypothetical protein